MDVSVCELTEQPVLGMHEVVPVGELSAFFGRAFSAVARDLERHGVAPVGPPVALYDAAVGATADVTAGFPTVETVPPGEGLIDVVLPAGPAVEVIHRGPYDSMEGTYADLMEWFAANKVQAGPVMWEEYLVGPDSAPDPADWVTRIVWPVQ